MSDRPSRSETARILVVAQGSDAAQAIARHLDADLATRVSLSVEPMQAIADVAESGAEVVLFAYATLAANERMVRTLRGGSGTPVSLVLCGAGELAAAAALVRGGVFDDYLQSPVGAADVDVDRLSTSVRVAARLASISPPKPSGRARPIVMLVEDDEFSHQLVAITLESQNIELVAESDGAAALDRIRSVQPDLILMDIMLPGRDGVELTQHLKADPALADIPVVMLTGEARRETLVRSMEAGAADFIVKPFTPDALIAKLTKFLPSLR